MRFVIATTVRYDCTAVIVSAEAGIGFALPLAVVGATADAADDVAVTCAAAAAADGGLGTDDGARSGSPDCFAMQSLWNRLIGSSLG